MAKKSAQPKVADKSPKVFQREKISYELNIRERDDLTEKQIEILKAALDKDTRCIFIDGLYGSAKSYTAVLASLKLLDQKKVDQIIYVRNPIESSKSGKVGFLKGPQPEYSKILTPNGWTTMGDIQEGDVVCTPDGENVEVLNKYEMGEQNVYKLTTLDGREVFASEHHVWEILENNKPGTFNKPSLVTTAYIRDNIKNRHGKFKITLPDVDCVNFPERELPVNPYVLGVLIGDGSICGHISFSNVDNDLIEKMRDILSKENFSLTKSRISYHIKYENGNCGNKQSFEVETIDENGNKEVFGSTDDAAQRFGLLRWKIQELCRENKVFNGRKFSYAQRENNFSHPIKNKLLHLGLLGKKAWDKFIPDIYKFSSKEQRLELLRGLMDTDGNITTNGECVLTTTSKQLAEDVKELVIGLGGKSSISIRDRIGRGGHCVRIGRHIFSRRLCYSVNVSLKDCPFFIQRKAERFHPREKWTHRVKFKSVELVGKEPCFCIKIDSKRALYLTDGIIPTHNTMEEKIAPYSVILYDKLDELLPPNQVESLKADQRIDATSVGFVQGKNWACKAIIVDECANLHAEDFVMLLTRCAEFTRIFFIGDSVNQNYLGKDQSGFRKMFDKFNDDESKENGIHCFELRDESDIVRSKWLRFVLKKLEIIK